MSIDFQTLQHLSHGKAVTDAPCPTCSAGKSPSGRTRKVLRIWNEREGFATFKCQRCGEHGYAHADNRPLSRKSAYDEAADAIAAFKAPTIVPVKQERDKDKLKMIRSLWRRSVPSRGTIVETYERTRKCWVDTQTVRYLPPLSDHSPAMIVPFGIPTEPEPGVLHIATADIHGIQLTKLKVDGSGKADVEPKKITLGQCVGYPIVLAPPNDLLALVIAEGVEDALTAHIASGRGAWASGGANRLPALAEKVPSDIQHVTVMMDDDDAGRRNANELGVRLQRRGIEVELLQSPQKQEAAA